MDIISAIFSDKKGNTQRFEFIDQFRGFVGILMMLGHSSYYINSAWLQLDPFDPLFGNWNQFFLRYLGYLCAPGFLMMNGAMVWWTYMRRTKQGISDLQAKWHLIQRGLFLVVVQITWVNASWGGFGEFKPEYFGIIGCIGISMIFLTLIIKTKWQVRIAIAAAIFIIHPFLIRIQYDHGNTWEKVLMQLFIDAGDYNKYPVLPWFALAIMGSVMAAGWLKAWDTDNKKIKYGLIIGTASILLSVIIRLGRGFGNIFPFSDFGSYSFLMDQKYPPSLYHNLWFFGLVVLGVSCVIAINKLVPKALSPLGIIGRVPLFFYCIHIALFGIFIKRIDLYYRAGSVEETLLGFIIMLSIMLPLTFWFGNVKRKSKNYIIKMI